MKLKYRLVQFRMFLQRAYSWIQIPLMVSGMIAILKPYIDNYIEIRLTFLIFLTLGTVLLIGYFERKLGVWGEELDYNSQQNPYFERRFNKIENMIREIKR